MKRTISGLIEAGEPLIKQAIEAHRRYLAAKDAGAPREELARLLLEAESLYQTVTDYQLRSLEGITETLH